MKTQKTFSKQIATTVMVVTSIMMMTSCGNNQGTSTNEEKNDSVSETHVNPPGLDIHTATFLGDLDAVKQHILAGTDIDQTEPSMGSSPLISATVFGKTEIARALIEAGADVNIQNNEGSTALHSAAFLCRTEIVEMLLNNGADKNIMNEVGSTALASVSAPFDDVRFIYDIFSKDLGPLGLKLDYAEIEKARPLIAEMLR